MKKIVFLFVIMSLSACTDESASRRTLIDSGYTNIKIGGFDFMSCSKDDTFSTHFTARNPGSHDVEGTVCCGLLKKCTVRF